GMRLPATAPPPLPGDFPYYALEAGGRSQVGRNCVPSLASLFVCGSNALRLRAVRPQLKRDPLGSATPHGNEGSPRFPLALLWRAPSASRGHGGRAGPHRAQPLAVSSTASAPGALPNKRLKLAEADRFK